MVEEEDDDGESITFFLFFFFCDEGEEEESEESIRLLFFFEDEDTDLVLFWGVPFGVLWGVFFCFEEVDGLSINFPSVSGRTVISP